MRSRPLPATTLPFSPEQDRHRREIRYAVMMGIRVVCLIICFLVPWPWTVLPMLGAVFLPYFAVLVANAGGSAGSRAIERPGPAAITRLVESQETDPRRRAAEPDASTGEQ